MIKKKKILILNGQYAPGYKGGGPIQSCINMVENLHEQFEFYVLCADRDYKCEMPYENIKIDEWSTVGNAKVFYMSPEMQTLNEFQKVINSIDFDIMYLNGFFSPIFTIKPLILYRLGKLKKCKIILTPRGDFTGGCESKKVKKYIYIYICKLIGLYNNLTWHATSELEENDISKKFPKATILTAPNLPTKFISKKPTVKKLEGSLKMVFVSRIFPKKNLKYALQILKEIKDGEITFDIYGPMEDKAYWGECENIIKEMPSNISVCYKGEVSHDDISRVFTNYHVFFFPTLGENYGHVIVESMMNNCLVVLSKGVTPWDEYGEKLGLTACLNEKHKFIEIIEYLLGLDQIEIDKARKINNDYIIQHTDATSLISRYTQMIDCI